MILFIISGSEAAGAAPEVGPEVSQARQARERLRWVARSTTERSGLTVHLYSVQCNNRFCYRSGVLRGQPPESPSSWTPILAQPQAKTKPLLHGFGRKLARDPQFRKVILQYTFIMWEQMRLLYYANEINHPCETRQKQQQFHNPFPPFSMCHP